MYVDAKDANDIWRIISHGPDHGCGRASCDDRVLLPDHKDGRTCRRVKSEDQRNETLKGLSLLLST